MHYIHFVFTDKEFDENHDYCELEKLMEPYQEYGANLSAKYAEKKYCTEEIECKWSKLADEEKEKYGSKEKFAKDWNGCIADGNGGFYYLTNPKGYWDWYVVGGRWNNNFGDWKEQEESFNRYESHGENACTIGKLKELHYSLEKHYYKCTVPHSYIDLNGNWHVADDPWDEKNQAMFAEKFLKYVNSLEDSIRVICVDCHT